MFTCLPWMQLLGQIFEQHYAVLSVITIKHVEGDEI